MGHGYSWPVRDPPHISSTRFWARTLLYTVYTSQFGLPMTACAVLGQHVPDCWASLVVAVENHLITLAYKVRELSQCSNCPKGGGGSKFFFRWGVERRGGGSNFFDTGLKKKWGVEF